MLHTIVSGINFHNHKMLQINEIIKLNNVKHAYKVQYSHLPTRIIECSMNDESNNSIVKKHRYSTRHKTSLNLPKTKIQCTGKVFCIKVLEITKTYPLL